MSRPNKPRYICKTPEFSVFGPKGVKINDLNRIELRIDEVETIRLIDHLGYTQEEAATQMNVARTTIQRIYNIARNKLAKLLIEGSILVVEGGEVVFCDENCSPCLEEAKYKKKKRK